MSQSEVDKAQLMKYIELEKEIQELESKNVIKNCEVQKNAAVDVGETIKTVETELKKLCEATAKEKADVDQMTKTKNKSIGELFQTEAEYQSQLSIEQEEYLEARNKEEVTRQQLEGLRRQEQDLKAKAEEVKGPAEYLKKLYEDRDNLLSDIFGGEYGSEKENQLEAKFDELMDRKQRVGVAHYKWTNARILLQHAVNQMSFSVDRWKALEKIPQQQMQHKYTLATESRNNIIAAIQNFRSTHRYLNTIQFPYVKEEEVNTLEKAANNIYTDMADRGRHNHALQCYDVTKKRAAALLQWFDHVIQNTIQKDLMVVTEEVKKIEKELRAERIKLIRTKVQESGGDVGGLNDTDQTKLSDEDMDMKGIGITRPAPVNADHNIPDAQQQQQMEPPAPTPLPLSELAPTPNQDDLFGNIDELKQQFQKDKQEFQKAQDLNKARMEQGLQAKLNARRHKRR